MSLEGILNISGKPGLYKVLKTSPRSVIVESMDERKRRFSVSVSQKMAALAEISIYTLEDQEMLIDVFKKMQEQKDKLAMPKAKAPEGELRSYFAQILPNYDTEKVYANDISKVIKWYALLEGNVSFEEKDEAAGDEEE